LNKAWTVDKVRRLIAAADVNNDGMLDFQELLSWIFGIAAPGADTSLFLNDAANIAIPMDDAIVQELTWVRTRPAEVAEVLYNRLRHYRGMEFCPPDRLGRPLITREGVSAVREAIDFLMEQAKDPVGGVGTMSELGLALAGEDHIADIGFTGAASHESSDGTKPAARSRRYGFFGSHGECLWYGSEHSDARMIVLDLIVDDGVASRGHRLGVFNPSYSSVGVAYGPHVAYGRVAAIEFARAWRPNKEAISARVAKGPAKPDEETLRRAQTEAKTDWDLGICPVCKQPIRGGKVVDVAVAGGKMHSHCFTCCACSDLLSGRPYKVENFRLYCRSCHAEKFSERCGACNQPLLGPASSTVRCNLGVFHVDCLVCSCCHRSIGRGQFSTRGGVMTCSSCSNRGRGWSSGGRQNHSIVSPSRARGRGSSGSRLPSNGIAKENNGSSASRLPFCGTTKDNKATASVAKATASVARATASMAIDCASRE